MAQKKGLVVIVRIEGVRETLRAFRDLPKDANDALRDASQKLAEVLAVRARSAAQAEGGQAALVAPTVKARRDRVPAVQAGGVKRVGRHRVPAYKVLFGSEFGMNQQSGWYARRRYRSSVGRQYNPHLGRGSYWFFATVEAEQGEIASQWRKAADDIVDKFGKGGA